MSSFLKQEIGAIRDYLDLPDLSDEQKQHQIIRLGELEAELTRVEDAEYGDEEKESSQPSLSLSASSTFLAPTGNQWQQLTKDSIYWRDPESWQKLKLTSNWPKDKQRQFLEEKITSLKESGGDQKDIETWAGVLERFS